MQPKTANFDVLETQTTILNAALKTIIMEADAVRQLASQLGEDFENAIQSLSECKGRIVVSGIGKSAIIAQKIVATLNSTGSPAIFLHAADAIHGDLGIVQQDDVVIIISKSGESPEIKVLVPLIRSFGNKLVGMCGNKNSILALQSDHFLNTTVEKEACPNNLAPTSSTTAQVVIGDALAVCLMELNEFTGKDFARYHPGGNLGKKLYLKVDDVYKMNEKPAVKKDAPLKDVIFEISRGRLGATAVIDENNKIIGIITDGDVRRMLEKISDVSKIKAEDIITLNPKTIQPHLLAIEAFETLKKFDINQLLIAGDNNVYLGILHLHDLIREGII